MVGCEALAAHITCGRLRPRIHAFGHIHEAHGAHIHSWESTGVCEPLQVQNDINYPIELTPDASEDEVEEVEQIRALSERCRQQVLERSNNPALRRTVFVNAANEPSGRTARNTDGSRMTHFGGPKFRPVVVDLKD